MSAYRKNEFVPAPTKWDYTPRKKTWRSRWDCLWNHHVFIYTTIWINWCPNGVDPPTGDTAGSHLHAFFACAYCQQPGISWLSKDYEKEMNFQDGRLAVVAFDMPGGVIGNITSGMIRGSPFLQGIMHDFNTHVSLTPPKEADYRWKDG